MSIDGGYEPETLTNIATLAQLHKIDTLVIESNFGDNMFSKMLEPYIAKLSPNTELEEVRATTNKENRIIDTIEPMLNSHRLVIDKSTLDADLNVSKDYSLTYQLTHITRDKDSIRHDDVIDSLSQLIAFMAEWISDDEDRGLEYHAEKEAEKGLRIAEEAKLFYAAIESQRALRFIRFKKAIEDGFKHQNFCKAAKGFKQSWENGSRILKFERKKSNFNLLTLAAYRIFDLLCKVERGETSDFKMFQQQLTLKLAIASPCNTQQGRRQKKGPHMK